MNKAEMRSKIQALETVATGQAAMLALLTGLLVQHKVLSQQEAMLVAVAGVDAQSHEGLTAAHVGEWIKGLLADGGLDEKEIGDLEAKARYYPRPRGPAGRGG